MSAAPTAVDGLRAPIGSPDWEQTRAVVRRYVQHREAARRCINDLEALRYGGHYFDPDDRAILIEAERRLLDFWLEQGDREAGILAKLVGIDTDAGHYPASLPR